MSQSFAVWLVIIFSMIAANLPFVLQRTFLVLPWRQEGEIELAGWSRALLSLLYAVLLFLAAWGAYTLIAGAIMLGGSVSLLTFLLRFIGALILLALVLAYPGWRNRGRLINKSFFDRLIELVVFYFLVGMLGFAMEANMGNPFSQTWEFYAVTFSLFLVLGYPGFVFRYLLRRRRHVRGAAKKP